MKEIEWHELCRRQQEQGREVTGVTLTAPSAVELANDILGTPGRLSVDFGEARNAAGEKHVCAGARVNKLRNRAAGEGAWIEVEVDPDASADTVTVRSADGETRVVVIAASASA